MSDVKTEEEPSIEEILESIRQIISEDDEDGGDAEAAAPPEEEEAVEVQVAEEAPEGEGDQQIVETVLELTEKVEAEVEEAPQEEVESVENADADQGDIDAMMAVPAPEEESADQGDIDKLLSEPAEDASADSMAKLLEMNIAVERDVPGRVGNVTLEDITKELMKPVIKVWLDQNLPKIVEKVVQKEIERVSKKALDQ